ncbi:hypothetical protein LAUMK42_04698 [Mycobacterium persicum]|jgi:hypothetical protein|uniref:Uncharacterized protein n=3 Tax=Mycobacterium TaxID=1763 RepID=A0AB38V1J2_9MYCO|nr:hypothetical protein LAUMK42_04698 [Mycobacterium persicum]
MNALLALTRTQVWMSAARGFRLSGRTITSDIHRTPPDQDRVRPRHYPPRYCSYLDDNLMNREMYNHVHDDPTRLTSRLAFRLRRS